MTEDELDQQIRRWTNDLSREERETVIIRSDADQVWRIATSSPVVLRRLWKRYRDAGVWPRQISEWTWTLDIPLRCVSFRGITTISATESKRRAAVLATVTQKTKAG